MSVRRILIAVSTSRYSRKLVGLAIREAEQFREAGDSVEIDVLTVIEEEALARAAASVGDSGLLGLEAQEQVLATLGAEHNRMARKRVAQVEVAAAQRGFEVVRYEAQGDFVDLVLARAEALHADVILLSRAERPFISRILFGSVADKVARLARRDGLGRVVIQDT